MITDEGFDVGLKLCVWAAPHTQMQQLHQRRLLLAFILIPVLAYGSLQQVVVVSRHGVRGPFGPNGHPASREYLDQYSRNGFNFPVKGYEWGTSTKQDELVKPKITKHGENVIREMGKYFRTVLYPSIFTNLNDTDDCQKRILFYADNNERDNVTAREFLRGLASDCAHMDDLVSDLGSDLLFQQGQSPSTHCPLCTKEQFGGILGTQDTSYIAREHRSLIQRINGILDCCQPSVCGVLPPNTTCSFNDIASTWTGKFYAPWRDTLSEAGYFSEWLSLQMLNNMTLPLNVSVDEIVQLSEVHLSLMNIITNDYLAANFGSTLLIHILASMVQTVQQKKFETDSPKGPQILQGLSNQFVYYAGHDINLLFLRRLLRLEWHTPEWLDNQPTPGGMLVFELHTNATQPHDHHESNWYVQLFFISASPHQIRRGDKLSKTNRPYRVPVAIPGCSETIKGELRCGFHTWTTIIAKAINPICVGESFSSFATHLPMRNTTRPSIWFAFLTIAALLLITGLTALYFCRTMKHWRRQALYHELLPVEK